MTEVTRSIPVTARFDGCWCDLCKYMNITDDDCLCKISPDDINDLGNVYDDTGHNYRYCHVLSSPSRYQFIRTRWCCETFGMGEQVKEQEQRDTTMDGVELETMDANNAETLRRWTS